MTVETAAFISGLVPAYPPGSDSISEGDDHLRLLKTVLQGTFPNANAAINGIHTGGSAPTVTSAGQLWYDTTSSNEVLKIRNSADSGWITLSTSPATDFKLLGATNVGWVLPTTDGSANQYLKTDASGNLDWASPSGSEIPSQTGNAGKFLTTDGSSASWAITATSGTLLGVTHRIDSSSLRPASNDVYENTGMYVTHTKSSATSTLYIQFDLNINTACNFDTVDVGAMFGYIGGGSGTPATLITDTIAAELIRFDNVGEATSVAWDASNTFSRTYKVIAANCPDTPSSTGANTFKFVWKMNDRGQMTVASTATWMVWEVEE